MHRSGDKKGKSSVFPHSKVLWSSFSHSYWCNCRCRRNYSRLTLVQMRTEQGLLCCKLLTDGVGLAITPDSFIFSYLLWVFQMPLRTSCSYWPMLWRFLKQGLIFQSPLVSFVRAHKVSHFPSALPHPFKSSCFWWGQLGSAPTRVHQLCSGICLSVPVRATPDISSCLSCELLLVPGMPDSNSDPVWCSVSVLLSLAPLLWNRFVGDLSAWITWSTHALARSSPALSAFTQLIASKTLDHLTNLPSVTGWSLFFLTL